MIGLWRDLLAFLEPVSMIVRLLYNVSMMLQRNDLALRGKGAGIWIALPGVLSCRRNLQTQALVGLRHFSFLHLLFSIFCYVSFLEAYTRVDL